MNFYEIHNNMRDTRILGDSQIVLVVKNTVESTLHKKIVLAVKKAMKTGTLPLENSFNGIDRD